VLRLSILHKTEAEGFISDPVKIKYCSNVIAAPISDRPFNNGKPKTTGKRRLWGAGFSGGDVAGTQQLLAELQKLNDDKCFHFPKTKSLVLKAGNVGMGHQASAKVHIISRKIIQRATAI
ncbi:hypothetical protein LOAG_07815, partial [Loa loa]